MKNEIYTYMGTPDWVYSLYILNNEDDNRCK